jgi:hypothetical protein
MPNSCPCLLTTVSSLASPIAFLDQLKLLVINKVIITCVHINRVAKQLEDVVRKELIIEIYGTFYCSLSIVLNRILRILVILTCLYNIIWKLKSLHELMCCWYT